MESVETYTSMAQRAAASYLRSLAGEQEGAPSEQRDLRGFFAAFYAALYAHPEQFGLPLVADDAFVEGEPNGTAHKAELNRKLKKPRDLIAAALEFLAWVGREGNLEGVTLALKPEMAAHLKKSRGLRAFFQGLEVAGLRLVEMGGRLYLENSRFPAMLPTLQSLARACALCPDERLGVFHFARCDFRALRIGFVPDPLDLYAILPPGEAERAVALHHYFSERKYQAVVSIAGVEAWLVQYQGRRQVKATPLFQVEYQERYRNPAILAIKPASTARLAPFLPARSQALQDDFFRRANPCRGADCGWCKNNKNLGPTTLEHNGQPVMLCWYINPTVVADDHTVALIQEYAELHEALA